MPDKAGGCTLVRPTGRRDSVSFTWYKLEAMKAAILCSRTMCDNPLARRTVERTTRSSPQASHMPPSTLRLGTLGAFLARLGEREPHV